MIAEVSRLSERASLRIELRDDLDAPVEGAEVLVTVEGEAPVTLRTDARGVGSLDLTDEHRARGIRAEYRGSAYLDGSAREISTIDTRARVELVPTLASPGALALDEGTQVIRVHARSSAGAGGLIVRAKDETGRSLAVSKTDALGRAHLAVASHDLGEPGPGRLVFESEASETHRAASIVLPVVRTLASRLVLEAPPEKIRPGQALVVRGALENARGPLTEESVGLWVNGVPVAHAVTDPSGRFRLELVQGEAVAPVLEGLVRFSGSDRGADPVDSEPFMLTVRAPFPKWPFVLFPLAFVAFLAFARRRRLEAGSAPRPPRRPLRALFERPTRSLRLRLEASRDRRPIEGARLLLDGTFVASSDAGGQMVADDLEPGAHRAEIEAEGFVRYDFELVVPMRGHAPGPVTMIETREAATRALEEVALSRGAAPERIAAATHREIGRRVERAHGELDDLVDDVDRAYYGPEEPSEERVHKLEERSRDLRGG